jgi:NADH-quinone oxidoreductase subunit E
MLSREVRKAIEEELGVLPDRRATCIGALKAIQRSQGWVSDQALADLAAHLNMDPAELESVATFYNLVHRRPVGRHVIYVCDSVSCWLLGCDELIARLRELLGVGPGETSADGRFTLLPIACLGNCEHAPALLIDRDLHRSLTTEQLPGLLERYP